MGHASDNASRLTVTRLTVDGFRTVPVPPPGNSDVWLFVLPFDRRLGDCAATLGWFESLRSFAERLGPNAVLAVLTSAEDAAVTWPELSRVLRFQLWIAVKLAQPIRSGEGRLPEHHAALLVLTKYRSPLRHTKTRIGYTYCPVCDRTTKDYGGKKHTYHQYGTLVSDVWRDIAWDPDKTPGDVATRLADLFGLDPHRRLYVVQIRDKRLRPKTRRTAPARPHPKHGDAGKVKSRLVLGDCLEVLRSVPDASVDFCFADPPYNLEKRYDNWDDGLDITAYFQWCDQWLDQLARVLRPGRTCAVLNIPQWAVRHFSHLKTRLTFQNWIVWEGLSLPVRMIMPAHYSIVCFSNGPARPLPGVGDRQRPDSEEDDLTALKEFHCLRDFCVKHRRATKVEDRVPLSDLWWDIHRLKHNCRRVDHPCQLPPALMRRLIALFTCQDEVVLDPFNGAGTTSLCAEMLGRCYLGIELSESYHNLAVQRHQLLRDGADPFAKVSRVPAAKNSRVKRIGAIGYKVSKKVLQLEVREIARELGRLPTREEVERCSKYPLAYFEQYFISWGEVCAAARTTGMKETRDRRPARRGSPTRTLFGLSGDPDD